ncbi:NAD(P)/FAD-dependent oxidoreductase [Luteimonas pelagia]
MPLDPNAAARTRAGAPAPDPTPLDAPGGTASVDGAHVTFDVCVVGGGPAGSTVATLLSRRGWRVALLEKASHPRFHIGESLLPMNMPILERLGVAGAVRALGTEKRGADFPTGDGTYNVFAFDRALHAAHDHAFQVPRDRFDALLFSHARSNGVDARQDTRVESVAFDADGALVRATGGGGAPLSVRARYVVDASGRDTFLAGKLGLRRPDPKHRSAAVFSHFRGVEPRPAPYAGNITIIRHPHGWIWLIPLPGGVTSVGAVCAPEHMKSRRGDSEELLMRTLEAAPEAWRRMRGAERIAPVHATGNYSYECSRMHGPGWLLLGDAWTFVDPMFSSGVFLAMHGAERAADAVDTVLRAPARERRTMAALERHLRGGLDEFKWFIHRFTTPAMAYLFARPRDVLGVERAVIAMLAGDVFDNRAVRWRLRVFRLIYAATALGLRLGGARPAPARGLPEAAT